jgi:Zn-dependent protease with chaperone function
VLAEVGIAAALAAAIATPHALPLQRVAPLLAAAVWINALLLRAAVAVGGAIFLFLYLPQSALFEAVARWCWHEVVPLLAVHLGLSGEPLAHAAHALPTLALAASVMWLVVGLARAWVGLRRQLRGALGDGPAGSTVIPDDKVVVALTGLGRPRIVLSAAALSAMDAEELRASMAHERGHLRRRHRPLLLAASLLSALARPLPWTQAATRELAFHLERDADEFAVRETRDPLSLASALCKAAQSQAPALMGLASGGRLKRRLEILVDGGPARSGAAERIAAAVATALAAVALAIVATIPTWIAASPAAAMQSIAGVTCPH